MNALNASWPGWADWTTTGATHGAAPVAASRGQSPLVDPIHYLAAAGIITPDDAHRATATNRSRSHAVWLVAVAGEPRYVVKLARPRDGEAFGNLGAEPRVYELAVRHPAFGAALPRCRWIDPHRQLLVVAAVEPGESLLVRVHRLGPDEESARALGGALGQCHAAMHGQPLPGLPRDIPWILRLLEPGGWRPASTDRVLVHGAIRRDLREVFAALAATLEPSTLVHNDLKWDNCLPGQDGVKIVDWEMAAHGDPAWDVAGILHEYTLLACTGAAPRDAIDRSRAAFLGAYQATAIPADPAMFTDRAGRLSGARLVQTALEHAALYADERLPALLVAAGMRAAHAPGDGPPETTPR